MLTPLYPAPCGRRHLRGLVLPAALSVFCYCASGATYYVATTGDDASPGDSGAPLKTLQKAANMAVAGDTVIVRDGTYGHVNAVTGGDAANFAATPVALRNSGNPTEWITFKAENKWGAILDCELMCDAYFNLLNASYIIIQDFVITRGYKEGIHSNDAAHHIVLRGNRFEYIGNRYTSTPYGLDGMYANANCHDFLIEGNVFHDIGRTAGLTILNHDHGLYMSATNVTIINNIFYNMTRGWAIQSAQGATNWLIAHNTFAFQSAGDGQIQFWNGNANITVQNNIFYNPGNYAIARYTSLINTCTIDHNVIYKPSRGLFDFVDVRVMAASTGCSVGSNQTGSDPMFINATTPPYDFRLRPDSPAIDAGVSMPTITMDFDGNPRPQGGTYDIGAFEFTPAGSAKKAPARRIQRARLR